MCPLCTCCYLHPKRGFFWGTSHVYSLQSHQWPLKWDAVLMSNITFSGFAGKTVVCLVFHRVLWLKCSLKTIWYHLAEKKRKEMFPNVSIGVISVSGMGLEPNCLLLFRKPIGYGRWRKGHLEIFPLTFTTNFVVVIYLFSDSVRKSFDRWV